ncbi:speckle-type POZ protein-like isoform X1 [Nasonia vitripennis]|uniref:Roadkill n=2 Tax=Nasonia vitripennis TaxID=7425 RepID=A0A7M7G3S6_NASVI|nr:speckle-type POZ protein-like isoform X1 [Nasonia vitripennis]
MTNLVPMPESKRSSFWARLTEKMSNISDTVSKKLSSLTQVEVIRTSYIWTIHNFSFLSVESTKKVKSSVFTMGANKEYQWRLRMYPHGCDEEDSNHLSLFLQLVSPTDTPVSAKFDFSIIKPDGQKHTLASHKIRSYTQWKSLGYHELIERSHLLDERTGYMSDDTLKVSCDVSVATGNMVNQPSLEEPELPEPIDAELNLLRDLDNMLSNKIYADVGLLVGDDRFEVHKALLSARSRVFAAMFEHDMKEKQQSEVRILDIEKEVLEELIRFLYTGRVKEIDTIAPGLLAAADKYALNDLKLMCERSIFSNLTVDNVLNTLVIADRHNSLTLKQQAIEFMKANAPRLMDNLANFLLSSGECAACGCK